MSDLEKTPHSLQQFGRFSKTGVTLSIALFVNTESLYHLDLSLLQLICELSNLHELFKQSDCFLFRIVKI